MHFSIHCTFDTFFSIIFVSVGLCSTTGRVRLERTLFAQFLYGAALHIFVDLLLSEHTGIWNVDFVVCNKNKNLVKIFISEPYTKCHDRSVVMFGWSKRLIVDFKVVTLPFTLSLVSLRWLRHCYGKAPVFKLARFKRLTTGLVISHA